MKTFLVLSGLSAAILIGGCKVENAADSSAGNINQPSAGTLGRPANQSQNNLTVKNQTAPVPKPTVSDDGDTKSIYTDLASEKCRTIESNPDEGGSYKGECKGVGGYKLEVLEGDLRQTINLVSPNNKTFELDFTLNVSSAFSAVGEKAEWRVNNKTEAVPYALIVRYNASEDVEKPEKTTSYLVVSKITKDAACITDVVKPSKDQNRTARKSADESANKPCVEK